MLKVAIDSVEHLCYDKLMCGTEYDPSARLQFSYSDPSAQTSVAASVKSLQQRDSRRGFFVFQTSEVFRVK